MESDQINQYQNTRSNGNIAESNDGTASLEPPSFQLKSEQPIQMYSIIKPNNQKPNYFQGPGRTLRVSDDGKMAVNHINGVPDNSSAYQDFYATTDIINHSRQVMAQVGSGFVLAQGANSINGRAPGQKNDPVKTLYKVDATNQDLARHARPNNSFNACSANMQNVMGILRLSATDQNDRKIIRDVNLRLEGSLDHDKKTINTSHDLSLALAEANKVISGNDNETEARNAVRAFSKSVMKVKAEQYGLNEHALPNVGEGYAIKQGGKGGEQGYGHFAPVIAQSGGDRVTLENDVSQKTNLEGTLVGQINPDWYFRMFGSVKAGFFGNKTDQTFHGEAKKHEAEDFGDAPFVARIGSSPKV